jgi:hypothetical protein
MSRALAMLVCGVIVIAHLSVVLFLLGRHVRDAAPAVPAHASQMAPEASPSVQEPAASRVSTSSLSNHAESLARTGA